MRVGIGADHGGFEMKVQLAKKLSAEGHEVIDFGNKVFDADDDYPDFATPLARAVASGTLERGILLCGSGVARAATQYGTGSFTWDAGISSVWSMASGGPYNTAAWTNGNDAVFEGTAGMIGIDAKGNVALNYNSIGMLRGFATDRAEPVVAQYDGTMGIKAGK